MANTHSLDLELSSSQYAEAPDSASLSITGDISIECWIKLEQLPSTTGDNFIIVGKYDLDSLRSYALQINTADDKATFYFSHDGTDISSAIMNEAFVSGDLGDWIHLAVTVDVSSGSSGITFYKNGSSSADTDGTSNSTAIVDNTSTFVIGALTLVDNSKAGFFDGKIDEVRVWNDIRTAGEIAANYNKQLTGSEAGLVGYWKFNNDYTDETSNSNDLTASGSPVFSTDVPFTDVAGNPLFFSGGVTVG